MEDKKVNLYQIKEDNGDQFILRAYIYDGCLILEGHDFSETAKNFFGDEEYEYYYSFDIDNTNKRIKAFKTTNILSALVQFFDNKMKNDEFRKFCEENDVIYRAHVV